MKRELSIENKTLGNETFNISASWFVDEKRMTWVFHILICLTQTKENQEGIFLIKNNLYKEFDISLSQGENLTINHIKDAIDYFKEEPFSSTDASAPNLTLSNDEKQWLLTTINDFKKQSNKTSQPEDSYYGI